MRDSDLIQSKFDRATLRRVCTMHEFDFGKAYDMERVTIDQPAPEDFYFFRDHGSNVLAVAHLDTVGPHDERGCHFIDTEAGEVVYSRALDDRLGAYIILELLPALGIQYDILLTVGEEMGLSTATGFVPPAGKDYDWIIEFDRGGTDVVMYQYDTKTTRDAVRRSGAKVGDGIFSDICYLEHLEVAGFNWGVGYQDYHGPRAHAYLDDTFMMLGHYLKFHRQNDGVFMPHTPSRGMSSYWWDDAGDDGDDSTFLDVGHDDIATESFDNDGHYFDNDYVEWPTPEDLRYAADAELWRP